MHSLFAPLHPRNVTATLILGLGMGACTSTPPEDSSARLPEIPETRRGDQVDDYFGTQVADPYRWLEDLDGEETAAWIEAQNTASVSFLDRLATREEIRDRLEELWDFERYSTPVKRGEFYFFERNDGLQDQSVLFVADDLDAEPSVLLDPNGFSDDGTISLASIAISPDGTKLAYAQSDGGTDWKTWRVLDVATGEHLPDLIEHTKFTTPSWTPAGDGFFYSRYPLDSTGKADGGRAVSVYHHALGTDQRDDELIWSLPDHPTWNPYAEVTEDGRHLVVTVEEGSVDNAIAYRPLSATETGFEWLFDAWDGRYVLVGSEGPRLFFEANHGAPMGRLIAIDPGTGESDEVIPERSHRLEGVTRVDDFFVARYLRNATSAVTIHDLDGQVVRDVEVPGIGSVDGFSGSASSPETFFSFTGFTTPGQVFHYDVSTGATRLYREAAVAADLSAFETEQVFYESKDGTRVPMFLVWRTGMQRDGSNPTLLYGYGGFDISLTPTFRVDRLVWVERGGILAIPNLRGGGEYGEEWHLAGTKERKQNVFDDFIAAAEYLIENRFTSPGKLAIQGGSNGGLLVGATLNQRPDLFGAALPAVGVMDMLRYHLPSANARTWSSDYGLSENESDFRAQFAYSPLHNVAAETCYPPTLVTTADHDDRVVPWHSFKYAAEMQYRQACDAPILIRIETRAGHGAGKPTWMRIEEVADAWSFLDYALSD